MTAMSAGLSTAAMIRAARTIFSLQEEIVRHRKSFPQEFFLLPGLANVDHIDTVRACFPQVGFHMHLEIFGTDVTLGRKKHLNVLRGGIEDRG